MNLTTKLTHKKTKTQFSNSTQLNTIKDKIIKHTHTLRKYITNRNNLAKRDYFRDDFSLNIKSGYISLI